MGKPASGPVFTCTVSPSPRLLVSAGPASSCLRSWQLEMGPEEELVFSSLLGEWFLSRVVPWPQRRGGPQGQLNAVVSFSVWTFWSFSESTSSPEAQAWVFLVVDEGRGRGVSSKDIKCPSITQWGAQLSHLQKSL